MAYLWSSLAFMYQAQSVQALMRIITVIKRHVIATGVTMTTTVCLTGMTEDHVILIVTRDLCGNQPINRPVIPA